MAYTNSLLASKHLRPVDILTPHWLVLSLAGACYSYFKYLPIWWIPLVLYKLLWKSRGIRTFITINQKISRKLSWLLYLCAVPLDDFETDFRQAWIEQLDSSRNGDDEVLMVNIFVGKESIPVPVLFNRNDEKKNRDAETFRQLRMWYFWMQYKRGLAELVLPRQLMYIERIKVSTQNASSHRLLRGYRYARVPKAIPSVATPLSPSTWAAIHLPKSSISSILTASTTRNTIRP